MRLFEFLSSLFCLYLGWKLYSTEFSWGRVYVLSAVCACIALVSHVSIEHARWQMAPLYLSLLLLLLCVRYSQRNETSRKRIARILVSGSVLSIVLALAIPIVELPAPTGKFAVGTRYFILTDGSRIEKLVEGRRSRSIPVQIWYPSQPGVAGERAPYMRSYLDLSPFLKAFPFAVAASHLPLTKSHSIVRAPLPSSESSFPVLIFSHGMMGGSIQNTVLAERLAANGYIVIGIDHTYDCAFANLQNETICSLFMTQFPPPFRLIASIGLEQRIADERFVLDLIQKQSKSSQIDADLFNKADLEHVGVYGHSLGGQTSLLTAASDSRVKAVVSLDGVTRRPAEIKQATMLLTADHEGTEFGAFIQELIPALKGPRYIWHCRRFRHADFTDLPLLTPFHWVIGLSGAVDPSHANELTNNYVLAFFNKFLKGDANTILDSSANPDEIEVLKD